MNDLDWVCQKMCIFGLGSWDKKTKMGDRKKKFLLVHRYDDFPLTFF